MKKNLLLAVLSFSVLSVSAQDIIVKATSNKLHEVHSLKEMDNISHGTDAEGNPCVTIEMRNAAKFTFPADDITASYTETRNDVLKRGRYANMVYAKTFDSVDELNKGDLIGIFNEQDFSTDEFVDAVSVDVPSAAMAIANLEGVKFIEPAIDETGMVFILGKSPHFGIE